MGWGTSRPDAGGETESLAAIAGPISVGRGDRAEAGANLCPGQPAPQPESGAGDVGAGDLESWPTKRLWKRRAGEKSNSRLSPRACKSRKKRAIRTFPQPRRRPFSGYIFHVSTAQPKVTFSNGLTRARRLRRQCPSAALLGFVPFGSICRDQSAVAMGLAAPLASAKFALLARSSTASWTR